MTQSLSRRAVVAGLGSAMLGAGMLGKAAAAVAAPLPSLEEIFGAARMARMKALHPSNRRLQDIARLDVLIGPQDRFRASPLLQQGLARFLLHHEPVEVLLLDDPDPHCQPGIDVAIMLLFAEAGLMPAEAYAGMPSDDPMRYRFWRGEDWRKAGWPPPWDREGWVISPILPLRSNTIPELDG